MAARPRRYQQRDDGYRQNSRVPRTEEEEEEAPAANAPGRSDAYPGSRQPYAPRYSAPGTPSSEPYAPRTGSVRTPGDDAYRPPATGQGYEPPRGPIEAYPPPRPGYAQGPYPPPPGQPYGQPYPPPQGYGQPYSRAGSALRPALYARPRRGLGDDPRSQIRLGRPRPALRAGSAALRRAGRPQLLHA